MQLKLFNNEQRPINNVRRLDIRLFKHQKIDKVRPFLRYPGSKYNASKFIEPFWSNIKFDEYREPFLGSGAVFFKMPKTQISWLNDIDDELINTFLVIADRQLRLQLVEKIHDIKPTKENFEELKGWKPTSDVDRAFRYFVINRTAYSGIMNLPNFGFHPTKSVQPDKWVDRIIQAGEKLQDEVRITKMAYQDVINAPTEKSLWLFIDPPYFKADQKRAYLHSFEYDDHMELLELLKKTNHNFCLTYDNCEDLKRLYSWANIYEIEWMYHTANSNVTSRKMGRELIIVNYEIEGG